MSQLTNPLYEQRRCEQTDRQTDGRAAQTPELKSMEMTPVKVDGESKAAYKCNTLVSSRDGKTFWTIFNLYRRKNITDVFSCWVSQKLLIKFSSIKIFHDKNVFISNCLFYAMMLKSNMISNCKLKMEVGVYLQRHCLLIISKPSVKLNYVTELVELFLSRLRAWAMFHYLSSSIRNNQSLTTLSAH